MSHTILVVDDEPHIRDALTVCLRGAGYRVLDAADAETALTLAATAVPDLLIIDMGLPAMQGPELVRRLRSFTAAPVLILSARDADADKVRALDEGADDYVTKPFGVEELLARLRALLRRVGTDDSLRPTVIGVGEAVVDLVARSVTVHGVAVRLTSTEWSLLEVFLRNPGKLLTRNFLINALWGGSGGSEASSLRIYVSRLRRIIELEAANPRHLLTETGAGYRLITSDPRDS